MSVVTHLPTTLATAARGLVTRQGGRVAASVETFGGVAAMTAETAKYAVLDLVTGQFPWKEFFAQAWFITSVTLVPTLLVAAGLLAVGALSVLVLPLRDTRGLNRDLAVFWPQPHLEIDPELDAGPILVTRRYTILRDQTDAFLTAWRDVRRSRKRTGATSCALYRDGLGLRLALDRTFDERGVRLLFFRIGGTTVEVAAAATRPPDPSAADRFGGLAWKVEDADAARRRLVAAGFDVSEVRMGNKPGTRVCTVRDAPAAVPTLILEPAAPGV